MVPDPLQPAERGGSREPGEETDHSAAAGYRIFLCADGSWKQRRRAAATRVHPNSSGPAEDKTSRAPSQCGGGRPSGPQPAQSPRRSVCKVRAVSEAAPGWRQDFIPRMRMLVIA